MSDPRSGGTPGPGRGDDETEVTATPLLSDDVIEAIVHDRPVDPAHASLVTFARSVRALGDGPTPRPSAELAALLEHGFDAEATRPSDGAGTPRAAGWAARVASLGIVAKIALGSSLAAAGVGAAGAAGVLPAPMNETVRHAIDSVSPIDFDDGQGGPGSDEPAPPSTAPAAHETDATDPTVADDATDADHRPDPGAVDEPPGQSGETGLTRANQTPAEPHAPDTTPAGTSPASPAATAPSTIPTHGPADQPGQGRVPDSAPSTVPASRGDHADDHNVGA